MADELPFIKNWRVHDDGVKWTEACEVPLLTDIHATNEVRGECGPYWFLNTVPIQQGPGVIRAAIVLRCHFVTDPRQRHRGYGNQEIANRFRGAGLAGMIEKPYQMKALGTKLREALAPDA
jgi:hypothetical protein